MLPRWDSKFCNIREVELKFFLKIRLFRQINLAAKEVQVKLQINNWGSKHFHNQLKDKLKQYQEQNFNKNLVKRKISYNNQAVTK